MSKKKKNIPQVGGTKPIVKPTEPKSSPLPSHTNVPTPFSGDKPVPSSELIRFDKRVKWTLGIITGLFFFMVICKLHYVSVPIWNRLLPDGSPETRGLISGTPRQIRMDDYAVSTPWIMSNAHLNYPIENETIGGLKSALLVIIAKHPIALFKFNEWGYLLFDLERGYAWSYTSGPFILLLGSLLFFSADNGNQFWLSLTGSLTLLLSSGTVAWAFIPSSTIGYCCLAFVAAVYLLKSTDRATILIAGAVLIWTVISYILILYPPYQVPLAYLFGFVLLGYIINERANIFPLKMIPLKLISLVVSGVLAGVVLYLFKEDVQETITAVTNTVYPGKRSEVGGTGFIANWYSEYYSWFFSDTKLPKNWLNSCEMAHYLNFVPTVILFSVALFIYTKRIDWMVVLASVFVLLMLIWIELGFPKGLANLTLMSMSPTRRAQIPMGVGSIVLLFLYLSALKNSTIKMSTSITFASILIAIAFVIYTAYVNINDSEGMIKPYQTFAPVLFFIGMNVLLIASLPFAQRIPIFCIGLLLFLAPNIKVNPLSVGLSPITENQFYRTVRDIVQKDPEARWMVNGSQFVTYMVTATGAKQITGVKFLPDRKHIFSILDPEMKRDSAYNRYAHVTNQSYINGRDSVILVNQFEDAYVIAMDPCSPKMKQLNVKYQVFDHQPQPVEVRCMKPIATLGSLTIYQANP